MPACHRARTVGHRAIDFVQLLEARAVQLPSLPLDDLGDHVAMSMRDVR